MGFFTTCEGVPETYFFYLLSQISFILHNLYLSVQVCRARGVVSFEGGARQAGHPAAVEAGNARAAEQARVANLAAALAVLEAAKAGLARRAAVGGAAVVRVGEEVAWLNVWDRRAR